MLELFDSDTLLQSAAHKLIVMIIKIELGLELNLIEMVASLVFLIPNLNSQSKKNSRNLQGSFKQ